METKKNIKIFYEIHVIHYKVSRTKSALDTQSTTIRFRKRYIQINIKFTSTFIYLDVYHTVFGQPYSFVQKIYIYRVKFPFRIHYTVSDHRFGSHTVTHNNIIDYRAQNCWCSPIFYIISSVNERSIYIDLITMCINLVTILYLLVCYFYLSTLFYKRNMLWSSTYKGSLR